MTSRWDDLWLLLAFQTIDVWRPPVVVNSPADIRISVSIYDDVFQDLLDAGFVPEVLIDDVQALIESQMAEHNRLRFQPKDAPFNYSKYHTLDEVQQFCFHYVATVTWITFMTPVMTYLHWEKCKIYLNRSTKKPTKWLVRPAKTQIRLQFYRVMSCLKYLLKQQGHFDRFCYFSFLYQHLFQDWNDK